MAATEASGNDRFHELLTSFSHGMLVTRTSAGEMHARPMAIAEIDGSGNVWFTTSHESGKVDEIESDAHVCVTFQDERRYLSLTGTARIVPDRTRIKQLWNEAWRPWFPKGEDDPSLVLLCVVAHEGESWDRSGVQGLKYLFEAARARLERRQMKTDQQQHRKVDL